MITLRRLNYSALHMPECTKFLANNEKVFRFTYDSRFVWVVLAEFQAGSQSHGLMHSEISVQLVVLHDVTGLFSEMAQVALSSIDSDGT
jgi:hypothetical protein